MLVLLEVILESKQLISCGRFFKAVSNLSTSKTHELPSYRFTATFTHSSRAWRDLYMDFIEGLPKSEGYSVILVMVDRFTKYAHFIPIKHLYTAATIAKAVFDNVIKLHGLPRTIVSDHDKSFTSAFWKELFKIMGTQLLLSSAYHPQTDG